MRLTLCVRPGNRMRGSEVTACATGRTSSPLRGEESVRTAPRLQLPSPVRNGEVEPRLRRQMALPRSGEEPAPRVDGRNSVVAPFRRVDALQAPQKLLLGHAVEGDLAVVLG